MKAHRFRKSYLWGAMVILLITGVAKILSSFLANEVLLSQTHVLFPASNRSVYFWVGAMECLGVVYLLMERSWIHRWLFLTSLGILFGVYRAGIYWMGETSCGCLGSLGDWMNIPSWAVEGLLYAALVYLVAGGAWYMIQERKFMDSNSHNESEEFSGLE